MRRAIVLAVALVSAVESQSQPKPESVCQVLSDLIGYSGKLVRVRGKISRTRTTFVAGVNCPSEIRVGSVEFENIINLEWPGNSNVEARGPKVPFEFDQASFRILERALASWDRQSQEVFVTIEGLIVTRTPPFNLVHPRFPTQPIGFGHMGAAPAEFIVKRVENIQFVQIK